MVTRVPGGLTALPIGEAVAFAQIKGAQNVPTTATRVLKADPQRIAVMFQAPGANNVNLDISNQVKDGQSFLAVSKALPLKITDDDFPGLAAGEWWALSNTAASYLVWVETKVVP